MYDLTFLTQKCMLDDRYNMHYLIYLTYYYLLEFPLKMYEILNQVSFQADGT